jgi:hypothetical protein
MNPRPSPEPRPHPWPDPATAEPAPRTDTLPSEVLLGTCVDDHHEVWLGRVRVRWDAPSQEATEEGGEAWLPTLKGLVVRSGDRVLLTRPANAPEPVVIGVLDGLRQRGEAPAIPAAHRVLRPDESLRIDLEDGSPLLEVTPGENGPVVRLASGDVQIAVDGRLGIRAAALSFETHDGPVEIHAHEDVIVQGEIIRLN